MDYETLIVERSEYIATITLNRPAKLNALNTEMTYELYELLREIDKDKAVRAVILTGAGRAFCAGADMTMDLASWSIVEKEDSLRAVDQLILRLWTIGKPTVAAINGVAVGGGCALILPCDIRIASDNARFGFVFVKRGLAAADMGSTWFLPRIVGAGWAAELLLTGDIIDAQLAERIKLVNRVVPTEELMTAARQIAHKLASGPPIGLRMTKRALVVGATADLASDLEYESAVQTYCMQTKDNQEGVKAFLEKREAAFTGE